jgi:hypothetical protein
MGLVEIDPGEVLEVISESDTTRYLAQLLDEDVLVGRSESDARTTGMRRRAGDEGRFEAGDGHTAHVFNDGGSTAQIRMQPVEEAASVLDGVLWEREPRDIIRIDGAESVGEVAMDIASQTVTDLKAQTSTEQAISNDDLFYADVGATVAPSTSSWDTVLFDWGSGQDVAVNSIYCAVTDRVEDSIIWRAIIKDDAGSIFFIPHKQGSSVDFRFDPGILLPGDGGVQMQVKNLSNSDVEVQLNAIARTNV